MRSVRTLFILTILGSIICSFQGTSTFFEGVVTYHVYYKGKTAAFKEKEVNEAYGNKAEYFFKKGDYLILYNGTFKIYNLYNKENNRLYTKYIIPDTLFWEDAGQASETVVDVKLEPTTETVLGKKCQLLTVRSNALTGQYYSTRKYYFSQDLKTDPSWVSKHERNSMNRIYAETKAIPLKIIIDTDQFTLSMIALKIEEKELSDNLFTPDKTLILKESN